MPARTGDEASAASAPQPRHLRLLALACILYVPLGCAARPLGWLDESAGVDSGAHDLAVPAPSLTCSHAPSVLADDVSSATLAVAIDAGEIIYTARSGPFSAALVARSIAGGTTRPLGSYDVQWVTTFEHHAFFVEQTTVSGQPFAIRDLDLMTGSAKIIDHTLNIGQVSMSADTLIVLSTPLHRLDRSSGVSRDVPLPSGLAILEHGGPTIFSTWLPILSTGSTLWSYDVAKDTFAPIAPASLGMNSVAATATEVFAHAYADASFYQLSPTGVGNPLFGGNAFSFAVDERAFYSIELTTPGVRMTPRDGSPSCFVPLDTSLRDVIAIDADAVYVLVDGPMSDAGETATLQLLRIEK